ncbi:MATE family efflux transporter [Caulobacter sp. KR2-114]|uniref:MATE family efflux transporter n=1 Tax=Caulobacter sp. KR2-114 TaxID=3400912 RepID=UPI003C0567DF
MTHLKTLSAQAWPAIAALVIQNALGVITTALVGRLGDAALAGVGVANALFSVLLALLFGLDAAVQTLSAHRLGAGDAAGAGRALRRGLMVSAGLGVALMAVIYGAAPRVMPLAVHDVAAARAGQAFLEGFAPLLPVLGLNMTFAAYWYGVGRPGRALLVSVAQTPAHALLCWTLSLGPAGLPALGPFGAGLGASLAATFALGLHVALAWRTPGLRRPPPGRDLGEMARIGLPISLQQSLYYVGLTLAFTVIARIGVAPLAAASAINTLALVGAFAAGGVGTAAASQVSAALGRAQPREAEAWGWMSAGFAAAILAPFSLALLAFPEAALRLFLSNPATVALAVAPARLMALSLCVTGVSTVLGYTLRGAGSTTAASLLGFANQWLIHLPFSWWVGVRLGFGLTGVLLVLTLSGVANAALLALLWRRRFQARRQDDLPPVDLARRIVVMGGAGAGKSTLARRLGERLGLPVTHLDRLFYGPGWAPVGEDAFRARVAAALAGDAWVVEGTYHEAAALSLPRADLVIWLDRPTALRLWRTWRKTRIGRMRPRADRPDGCDEGFGLTYVRTILAFGAWTRAVEASVRRVASRATVLCLRSDRQVDALVERRVG